MKMMLKVIDKATFKLNKVLLICRDTDVSEGDYEIGTYELHTYDTFEGWNKELVFPFKGFYDDVGGWGEVLDSKAYPKFKDYCLAMLSDIEEK